MPDSGVETVHVPDGPLSAARLPRFGRFQALAELGAGAMGKVYRAHDDVLGRDVAIKVLQGSDGSLRERFLREAKAIGKVTHTNILAVYDAAVDHEVPYLVMELAEGSLRDRLTSGPLAADLVRQVGIQIAHGLSAAHAAGILHRDVKPGNILVAPTGVWKLADFGIARIPDSTLTAAGQFLGSPAYAAPESLRAGDFSAAADIYGLGATLYEALGGAPPHGFEHASIMRKLDSDAPPLPATVPASMAHAIMAALSRDPSARPVAAVFAQLLASADVEPVAPHAGAQPAANVLAQPAANIVAQPATNVVAQPATSVVAAPATNVVAQPATNVVAAPATNVVAAPAGRPSRTLVYAALGAAALAVLVVIAALVLHARTVDRVAQLAEQELYSMSREVSGDRRVADPSQPSAPTAPTAPTVPVSVSATSAPARCTEYTSDATSATWTGCPDEIVRKIACEPWMEEITCKCLEDGAQRWFFDVPTVPDFSDARTAARLARAQCKMGFGH